jgi:predicted AlkP superfamily phosphohydrolase/phosphomutase
LSSSNQLKLVVIGLDGATLDIIRPLVETGSLPNLKHLMRAGTWGPLRSTLPPVTAAAWSTFMTGLNPAKHGIFQWRTYDPTKYTNLDERVVTADRLAGRTFWDLLGGAGYRVGVITVPVTYPTWPVNGYMVSGYPCPDTRRNYTYPPEWGETLTQSYNLSVDHYLNASDEQILRDGLDMLRRRTDLALDLASKGKIDVCVIVLGAIDRAQHDFFKYTDLRFPAYHTAPPEFREAINRHYEVADEQVGLLLETLAPDGVALIISDHGGGPHPPRYFHTNAWLRAHGWLATRKGGAVSTTNLFRHGIQAVRQWLPFEEKLRRMLPAAIVNQARSYTLNIANVDWSRTRAYRFPMYHPAEGIEINLKGRQPQGCVEPGIEYEQLVGDVMRALRDAHDPETGGAIVQEAYFKEEIYGGPHLDIAPDIVFVCHPSHCTGVELGSDFTDPVDLNSLQKYNGVHTMDGILFAYGKGIAHGKEIIGAHLADIAPTVLHLAGLPVPKDMDGRVLTEILTEDRAAIPIEYVEAEGGRAMQVELTPEEEADMLEKLRGLGYVD